MAGGRPPAQIDQAQFEKLCEFQCTEAEICNFFTVTDKTLNAWCRRTYGRGFSDIREQKRAGGKINLRRAQFRLAETSASMAIFLGKNILGQRDNPADEATANQIAAFLAATRMTPEAVAALYGTQGEAPGQEDADGADVRNI